MEIDALDKLSALAHPRRLNVFRLLMRRAPDMLPAGEIAQILDLPASSLSAALNQLRQAGLVTQQREGTSLRYGADTGGAGWLVGYLAADCCRGRPSDCLPDWDQRKAQTPINVLFLCSGNSARSIFAQALLRDLAPGRFTVYSAGTRAFSTLNPDAVALLSDKGHGVSDLRAKSVSEYQSEDAPQMDFVFTVCDLAANEDCPAWTGQPVSGHWGVPDPVAVTGSEAERSLAFQHAYGALKNRIEAFAALPLDTLDRVRLQYEIDKIAKLKETS